ncbi:Fic family protein [Lentisalinibacter sediminis]|uniref:Fic family protein n=1 Tax=Lentisalinibacter sediminis TaxID=2992237 RepID=UPI00386C1B7F
MSDKKADIDSAKAAAGKDDRGENTDLMEPLVLSAGSRHRPGLNDLAMELAAASAGFRRSLPDGVMTALADLVRAMNCYYSNLIEGHDTHPVDIERALRQDYSEDPYKRNLQLEAEAHVTVQQWIDQGGLEGPATTKQAICQIHRRFCELLPDELLVVAHPETGEPLRVIPGKLREHDVEVGRHIPVSPGALPRFMHRFEEVYSHLGTAETLLAAAAAHHRLAWIHPFPDGNGRVMRLMSYATLLRTLDTGGAWSIARGLARNVDDYKRHLANCDNTRRNDLDGRGDLSEEALAEFTEFFLTTCLDQVRFMEDLVQPEKLHTRMRLWVREEVELGTLHEKAGPLLEAILYCGELPRGEVPERIGTSERTANRVVAGLTRHGVITSQSPRSPLRVAFPARLASRWMPGLFPEQR